MARITFAIVSPLGDTIPLDVSDGPISNFGLLDDTEGLGLVPRDVNVTTGSGEGGRLRSVRVAPRSGKLSILVSGDTGAELTANVKRLAAAVRTVTGATTPSLVATYESGDKYSIPFTYQSGAETIPVYTYGGAVPIMFQVIFPDPFWTALNALSVAITGPTTPVGILPDLARLKLTPSNASGTLMADNPGEAQAFPVWRIVGPETLVTATLNGKSWSIGPIAANEVVTLDSKTNLVTLADGTNVYNRLGPAPKLFPLPAGHSEIAVTITGAAGTSSATCYYRPRMELVI